MIYALLEFRREITAEVKKAVEEDIEFQLEVPNEERGDYALPCFPFASALKKSPVEIAEYIHENLNLTHGRSEIQGPYVNFWIDEEYLVENTVTNCMEMGDGYGELEEKDTNVIIEHTSANPNAPLHVGNARNPIIGDTMARIYERGGYDVETQYYVDDMGRQVAMTASGMMHDDKKKRVLRYGDDEEYPYDDPAGVTWEGAKIAKIYQTVSGAIETSSHIQEDVQKLLHEVERNPDHLNEYSTKVMDIIKDSLSRLNIKHNTYKSESELVDDGEVNEILSELEKTGKCGFEEGAQYIEVEDKRVYLRRSDGTSLYPGRDIAYHAWKAERCDEQIDILGEDHKLHAKSIAKALSLLEIEPEPQFIFHSFVTFEGEGMSTRSGKAVTLDELMDIAHEKAREEMEKRRGDLTDEEKENIAEMVGIGAVRFNIIKVQPEKHIDFRWEEALNFQGDSAPFIQYTYARASGILEKAGWREDKTVDGIGLDEEGEVKLIKKIAALPSLLQRSIDSNSPHLVAKYALELAKEFNQFYRDYQVLESEKEDERLALVACYRHCIKSVLYLLGIKSPDQM